MVFRLISWLCQGAGLALRHRVDCESLRDPAHASRSDGDMLVVPGPLSPRGDRGIADGTAGAGGLVRGYCCDNGGDDGSKLARSDSVFRLRLPPSACIPTGHTPHRATAPYTQRSRSMTPDELPRGPRGGQYRRRGVHSRRAPRSSFLAVFYETRAGDPGHVGVDCWDAAPGEEHVPPVSGDSVIRRSYSRRPGSLRRVTSPRRAPGVKWPRDVSNPPVPLLPHPRSSPRASRRSGNSRMTSVVPATRDTWLLQHHLRDLTYVRISGVPPGRSRRPPNQAAAGSELHTRLAAPLGDSRHNGPI